MRTTARRRPIERASLARRCVALLAIGAVSLGCVADTFSDRGVTPVPIAAGAGPVEPSLAPIIGVAAPPDPFTSPVPAGDRPAPLPVSLIPIVPPASATAAVPILYYHRVQAIPAAYPSWSAERKRRFTTYDVLPAAFAAQLDWLFLHGYTTILPRDLAAHWDQGAPLPERPVIITFDDGSRDWVRTVLPMLKARGMVAEFYLTLDAIKNGNLTWKEVRRLAAAGNGIGAHDVHHVQLAALGPGRAKASAATMWSEVSEIRRIIGFNVGVFPDSMAYVGGGVDATLERLVKTAGYTSARGIQRGITQRPTTRFRMRVVRIGVHDDVANLQGGALVPDLPTFTARMRGVSDKTAD
jgi:peptidoglycan/xylan/chitin deacetylase (PgdA/CDA1 family)